MSILKHDTTPVSALGTTTGALVPESMATNYGFAFIKSGFEPVQQALENDFSDFGLEVVHASPVVMDPHVVDYIYRDSRQEPFYPAMHEHLTTRPVVAMALYSDTQNAQETLNDLKCGEHGRPSLRKKYAHSLPPLPEDEIQAWYQGIHPNQDGVTVHLTQKNVFHAADSPDEAVASLGLMSLYNADFLSDAAKSDLRLRKLTNFFTTHLA